MTTVVLLAGTVAPAAEDAKKGREQAARLCASCHPVPPPDVLPRASWRQAIEKMVSIVQGKGPAGWGEKRTVSLPGPYESVLRYYEGGAPVALPAPEAWPAAPREPMFVRRTVPFPGAVTNEPAVANVHLADMDGDGKLELLACDMRQGVVLQADPRRPAAGAAVVAEVPHPSHVSVADLDGDGRQDLLVADLGEFFPGDHEKGAAVWLRGRPGGGYEPHAVPGLPRVADVEAGDFDGDGRLDLIAAAFGWWQRGETTLLLNRSRTDRVSFDRRTADPRAGGIHVVPMDLDGDGKLDFVGLLSQQYESVVAFMGNGKGDFRPQPLYEAPHPNWGSTGIQVIDLDGDGDRDVLFTNGDMFDDDILKPYHGIVWLENEGRLRFKARPLAPLAGAHRAVAADLDGDGDKDVAAAAFTGMVGGQTTQLPALVWLEQVKPGRFERRGISVGRPAHTTLDAGDVDGDGDIDLVTGLFLLRGSSDHFLEVWENQKVRR